jgi:hypothetical protein
MVYLFAFQSQCDGTFFWLRVSLLGFLLISFSRSGILYIFRSHGVQIYKFITVLIVLKDWKAFHLSLVLQGNVLFLLGASQVYKCNPNVHLCLLLNEEEKDWVFIFQEFYQIPL